MINSITCKTAVFFSSRWNHIGSTWAPTTSAAPALSTFVTMWIPVCCASLAVKRVVPRQKIGVFFKSDGFRLHDCIFAYIWLVCTVDAGEYTIRGSSFVNECKVTCRGLRSPSSNDGERRPPRNPPFWGMFLEKLPGKSFILLMSIVIYTIVLCCVRVSRFGLYFFRLWTGIFGSMKKPWAEPGCLVDDSTLSCGNNLIYPYQDPY